MPSTLSYPGVYVEEIPGGVHTITGVATSVTAFIGTAKKGPENDPTDITSYADFERLFGGLWAASTMSFAVRDFFLNGGSHAVIVRLSHGDESARRDQVASIDAVGDAAATGATGATAKAAAKLKADAINGDANAGAAAKTAATQTNAALVAALPDNADAAAVKKAVDAVKAAAPKPTVRTIDVDTLHFVAASSGSWSGSLRVLVFASSPATSGELAASLGVTAGDLFDLTVTDTAPGGLTESYLGLTVLDTVRRVDRMLADSALIHWAGAFPNPAPALPDLKTVFGDSVGQAYQAMINATKTNPDATVDPLKAAKDAYKTAVAKAMSATADGGELVSADFLNGAAAKTGLYALEKLYTRDGLFNLLCIPPYKADKKADVDPGVLGAAGVYCERRRALLVIDAPGWSSVDDAKAGFSADPDQVGYRGRNGALFFPRLSMPNPLNSDRIESFAACGAVAGIMARTDTQRGVWKSPAGLDASLIGVSSLTVPMTDDENGLLNPLGINCLRTFPVFGRVVWGARTTRGADVFADEYKYIAVRRTALYVEESLYRALKWVVFEPNDEPLWAQIRLNVGAFMHNLFRQGAFQGASARDAYFVKCDSSTTTQNDINLGVVNIRVGFAALKPAEFVVIQLQQIAGQIDT